MTRAFGILAVGAGLTVTLGGCGGGGSDCDTCTVAKAGLVGSAAKVSQCLIDHPGQGGNYPPETYTCACQHVDAVLKDVQKVTGCEIPDGAKEGLLVLQFSSGQLKEGCAAPPSVVRSAAACTDCQVDFANIFDTVARAYDCVPSPPPENTTEEQQKCICEEAKGGEQHVSKAKEVCKDEFSAEQLQYINILLQAPQEGTDCDNLPPGLVRGTQTEALV